MLYFVLSLSFIVIVLLKYIMLLMFSLLKQGQSQDGLGKYVYRKQVIENQAAIVKDQANKYLYMKDLLICEAKIQVIWRTKIKETAG